MHTSGSREWESEWQWNQARFLSILRRVGTLHHFYFDAVIPTSLGAKICSNVSTNILPLTAVLMGLRNIGNFFCHVCSIQRILSRDRIYDASSMLYSPNFLPRSECSYSIWRALNKRWQSAEKRLDHSFCVRFEISRHHRWEIIRLPIKPEEQKNPLSFKKERGWRRGNTLCNSITWPL